MINYSFTKNIKPEMIANYNKEKFEKIILLKKDIFLEYDYGSDMYVAKAFDGNSFYKI